MTNWLLVNEVQELLVNGQAQNDFMKWMAINSAIWESGKPSKYAILFTL